MDAPPQGPVPAERHGRPSPAIISRHPSAFAEGFRLALNSGSAFPGGPRRRGEPRSRTRARHTFADAIKVTLRTASGVEARGTVTVSEAKAVWLEGVRHDPDPHPSEDVWPVTQGSDERAEVHHLAQRVQAEGLVEVAANAIALLDS